MLNKDDKLSPSPGDESERINLSAETYSPNGLNAGEMQMNSKVEIPSKYDASQAEIKWAKAWMDAGIYRWDPLRSREETFVIDTPPPTVSGSLHVGHAFSFTHTDLLARFNRMMGRNIMYPIGWDDNGLPTERRVQNKFGICCDARLPYDPDWAPSEAPENDRRQMPVSRQNFIEACSALTVQDEKVFAELWQRMGLSFEWEQEYSTVGERCRAISQISFLDLVEKDFVYHSVAPTIWDVTFQSAIAQAELEDRVISGRFHDIRFGIENGDSFVISTTRPELLASCIAIAIHPEDSRFQHLIGINAVTPGFGISVPIVASEHVEREKGTGVMMIATFGDVADVNWWKSSGLPPRIIVGRDGRLMPIDFESQEFKSADPAKARSFYGQIEGKTVEQARKLMAEILRTAGSAFDGKGAPLIAEPKEITHAVKFFEKGDKPVEFVPSRQWYIRIMDLKEQLIEQGRKIEWHPDHMRLRYEHWVEGLSHDWCISRQRYFGVPFPVWYPLDKDANPNYDAPIFGKSNQSPIDPLIDCPPGFKESERGKPGGFIGDPDVMDTWATSSLTPQIISQWGLPNSQHAKLFPADIRPQSHELIRTWAFYTIAKAWMHHQDIPWKHVAISGWILDPDRKKMSKSKGNVVTPMVFIEKYSADAVRYWASKAKLGADTAFDEKTFEVGRKLSTKIFNASRFVLMQLDRAEQSGISYSIEDVKDPIDKAWLARMRNAVKTATTSFISLDHAGALTAAEGAFWEFCDNYLELVKGRCYSGSAEEKKSAFAALSTSIDIFLRMFAPFQPYVTEEIWQYKNKKEYYSSIHVTSWPINDAQMQNTDSNTSAYDLALKIVSQGRKIKSDAKKSGGWPVDSMEISANSSSMPLIKKVLGDISRTICVPLSEVKLTEDRSLTEPKVALSLATERADPK